MESSLCRQSLPEQNPKFRMTCGDRFKLHAGEFQENDPTPLYCPLCGMSADRAGFITAAARKVAMQHAENMLLQAVHNSFKDWERQTRGSKGVRFKAGPAPKKKPVSELREVTDLAFVNFGCCGLTAKVPHSDALSTLYCPYCGTEQV